MLHAMRPYETPTKLAVSVASNWSPGNRGLVGIERVIPDAPRALSAGAPARVIVPMLCVCGVDGGEPAYAELPRHRGGMALWTAGAAIVVVLGVVGAVLRRGRGRG